MSKSLEQVLGYVYLTGVIQSIKTGIPDVLPPAFATIKKDVLGDQGRYVQVTGTRKVARAAAYGSAARMRELKDISEKDVKLIHAFEQIQMKPLLLQMLRNYDNYDVQKMGIDEVSRQQAEFRKYFDNLRLAAVYSMLSLGHIYFDDGGNLLPTSSGAQLDVDYQISANNLNQLNGIITASWANNNTDIPLQLRNLKNRSIQQTGYPLKYAFYGVNIPSYLTQNNYVLDYLSRNPKYAEKYLDEAELPDGLFGYKWVPVHTAFFEDASGTNQTFFGGDTVVFTPEITSEVYEMMEGTYQVPTSFNAVSDLLAALGSMKQVRGMFSYAMPEHNPVTVNMFSGDTFLSVWKVPNALYIGDVVP
jgi:hypothetical protein